MSLRAERLRLGANLKYFRLRAGLSQEQVSEDINRVRIVQKRYYQELELGRKNPTLHTLVIIAKLLKTDLASLFGPKQRLSKYARKRPPQSELLSEAGKAERRRRVRRELAERKAWGKRKTESGTKKDTRE